MMTKLLTLEAFSANRNLKQSIKKGLYGLEKEHLRATPDGKLALSPHPKSLGNKAENPYITTDFSESQVEMITPPLPSLEEAHGFLKTLHSIVMESLREDEILWPQSMPPELPEDNDIPVADFRGLHVGKRYYRERLSCKYGASRQMMSGVHFNFSFDESLFEELRRKSGLSREQVESEVYLKVLRNLLRTRWFLVALLGRSPKAHPSFKLKSLDSDEWLSLCCHTGVSIRSSRIGYRNPFPLETDYSSFQSYEQAVQKHIESGKIQNAAELYLPVRIKLKSDQKRISHLEIRLIDLDPHDPLGLSIEALRILRMYLLHCLLAEDSGAISMQEQEYFEQIQHTMACCGLKDDELDRANQNGGSGLSMSRDLLEDIHRSMTALGELDSEDNRNAFSWASNILKSSETHPANRIIKSVDALGWARSNLELENTYPAITARERFTFFGFEDLELSTQLLLREAVKRGVSFEFLDRSENFIRLHKTGKSEHVMQATRTSLDPYSSVLVMENKVVTKKVLQKDGIRVPTGREYFCADEAKEAYWRFDNQSIVVKPKSTNFGLGITILKQGHDAQAYGVAVDRAFREDDGILVEEFIEGKEFRFFLIDAQVVGVLHRVPANITGDGHSSIRDLVAKKNEDPLRGKGYKTPLEYITLGEVEIEFLKGQGYQPDSVLTEGTKVYLRENSNISTGGDSIDYTEQIHHSYFEIASKAAKAVGARITGLDMMIENIMVPANMANHAIIEMNFNPAIHIHCFPLEGKPRPLQELILNRLGFV